MSLKLPSSVLRVLNDIGTPGCLDAAARLASSGHPSGSYTLHLRSSGIGPSQADLLAQAIEQDARVGARLESFSISYNSHVSDAGVARLVAAFPPSLTQVGLVGCGLGDVAGQALLTWVRTAPALRMLCVEDNGFSSAVRAGLQSLGQGRSVLMVVV